MNTRQWKAGVALTLLAATTAAMAAGSDEVAVAATVTPNCTTIEADPLDFGAFLQANTNGAAEPQATSEIRVICGVDTAHSIGINGGLSRANGQNALRNMRRQGSNATLAYQLYKAPQRINANRWTDGTFGIAANPANSGGPKTGLVGNGQPQAHIVYGVVDNTFERRPGNYSDTVTVIVTF